MRVRFLAFGAALLASVFLLATPPVFAQDGNNADATRVVQDAGIYEQARIERVDLTSRQTSSTGEQVREYRIKFLSGPLKNETRTITGDVKSNPYELKPEEGDRVVIYMQQADTGDWNLFIESFDRRAAIGWLIALFVLTLVVLSGWQGFKVAFSIGISIAMIGYILIPLFLRGWNPVPVAIVLGGLFTLFSAGLSTGWNRKSYVTAIGTMGGALIAYLVSLIFVSATRLTGLSSEEDRLFFEKNPFLNARGLLFAGIIIAAVGVLEDVAVSIASGVSEVKRANQRMGFRDLFLSGMVIGRDHMAALANTLVYAYVGASLSSLLLFHQVGGSWLKFVNFETVVDEIVRSLAGTIGLIFTIPITALLAAWVMGRHATHHETDSHHGTHPPHGHYH